MDDDKKMKAAKLDRKNRLTVKMLKKSMSLHAAKCHSIGGGSFSNVISGAKVSLQEVVWKVNDILLRIIK